jgi:hypothetical protein
MCIKLTLTDNKFVTITKKPFTFRPLSVANTHEIGSYVHITYIGNNETDTRHVVYRDIPAEKMRFSFSHSFHRYCKKQKNIGKVNNYGRIISADCPQRWKLFIPKFKLYEHAKKTVFNHHRHPLKFQRALS